MLDTKTVNFLESVGIQVDANRLIAWALADLTPLGDVLSGKGWVSHSPTTSLPETFVTKVGTAQYAVVTISGGGETKVTLTCESASVTTGKADTANRFRGGAMLSNAPTINVQPGMRVELTGHPTAVTLRGRNGTVVREDEDEDYVIVRLDTPALYRHFNGEVEELPEIVVLTDNLRVLGF